MKLVFATNNKHKLSELRQIAGREIEIVGLSDIGCHEDIPETGTTLQENALQKARYVNQKYGLDCFADDTGLEVNALGGAPGVYSARWAAMEKGQPSCTPDENVELMLQKMDGVDDRRACFRTCIALIQNGEEHLFDGRVDGEITRQRAGAEGFGYDPIFRPKGWDKTFAEASPEEKNAISHRGRATARLMAWLRAMTCLILTLVGIGAQAQTDGWHKYPIFADTINDIVETAGGKAYFLSGTNLYSFDPKDEEMYAYTHINKLSDNDIASIHYNREGKYLLVAYSNGNIDLLYDDGTTANLPDIMLSQISGSKQINSVAFGEHRIAVGTDFGLVVFDDVRHEVIESGIYNTPVYTVAIGNGRLYLEHKDPGSSNHYIVFAPLDQRHYSLEKFSRLGGWYTRQIVPIDETTLLIVDKGDNKLIYREVDHEKSTWRTLFTPEQRADGLLRPCADGLYARTTDGNLMIINGKDIKTINIPAQLRSEQLAIGQGPQRLWAGSSAGLSCVDITSGSPATIYGKMLPQGALTCQKVGYLRWSSDGERLYVSNIELSMFKPFATEECGDAYQTTNIIERGFPRDASLLSASADHEKSIEWQTLHGNSRMYGDPAWILEDPDNPGRYYCANNHEGLYVLEYNEQTKRYDEAVKFDASNSPIPYNWGARVEDVNIDPEGNLWVGYIGNYVVLPAAKRKGNIKNVAAADWKTHPKLSHYNALGGKDMMSLFCSRSQMAFMFTAQWEGGLIAVDTKGTYANLADDATYLWTRFTDQDGNSFEAPDRFTFAIEDSRGAVWLGTSAGIFEITNPKTATSPDMRVRRLKVPRNDGTNYADYLLESEIVNWICLDPAGRKWVATQNSGLFLVSATGDRIIKQINTDNSPLLTNEISAVECDPHTNTVYVGTPHGLYTFLGDASAPQDDYSDILAYPNPVRPDYTGPVTISGRMG
ncbi:MAG: RdgB/HAM1 family non-canonical purine NTP pyrophosphatase, partial [Muribaculaceae bacterium]|nr:RdgB/HAM1 family non-canonical purine NTP pyrophosphatase [Muribaculaceae bacterium]